MSNSYQRSPELKVDLNSPDLGRGISPAERSPRGTRSEGHTRISLVFLKKEEILYRYFAQLQ
jgi:hypothetical protein